jgi:hypothetical protein
VKSDRELLELAAKSADTSLFWRDGESGDCATGCPWNPLDDDGDALRLLVDVSLKRGLRLMPPEYCDGWSVVDDYTGSFKHRVHKQSSDAHAATRRSIVLAAAAIGESMP